MSVERIGSTKVADPATATWSNALKIGDEVVMSGLHAHPATRQAAEKGEPLGAYAQTLLTLEKILSLVEAAGGHKGNLYSLTYYLTDIEDKAEVGRARQDFFAELDVYPTATLVEVSGLVFPELCIEIEAKARLDIDLTKI